MDIGERVPFYEDFLKGRAEPLVTPDSQAKTQLCVTADYLQSNGDLQLLRNVLARVSSYTNFRAELCDFDWSEERFTVSIISTVWRNPSPPGRILRPVTVVVQMKLCRK